MKKKFCFMVLSTFLFSQNVYANPMSMDVNKDGKISREEATGKLSSHFDVMDANGDGYITKQELMEIKKKMEKAKENRKNGKNPMKMDADKDGKISRAEASDKLASHFDRIDTDSDGFITKQELSVMKKKMREKRQKSENSQASSPSSVKQAPLNEESFWQ